MNLSTQQALQHCTVCPRNCGADRISGKVGFCGAGTLPKVALVSAHQWEEPPISGTRGSGTVFFSHCNLRCVFGVMGRLGILHSKGIIPVFEVRQIHIHQSIQHPQAIQTFIAVGVIDHRNGKPSCFCVLQCFCNLRGKVGSRYQIDVMQSPALLLQKDFRQPLYGYFRTEILLTDVVVLDWIRENLGKDAYVSLLNQYTPMYHATEFRNLSRRLTTFEYDKVTEYFLEIGLTNGFVQKRSAATSEYTPLFDLSGVKSAATFQIRKEN